MRRFALLATAVVALAHPGVSSSASLDLLQPIRGPIARHFEPPPTPYSPGHRGIDFNAPQDSTVVAAAPGTISFAGQVAGQLYVTIDHGGGYRSTCSFLSQILVVEGQAVIQGQLIGRSGAGNADSGTPHLHFGLRLGSDYVDPEPFLLASIRANLSRVIRLAA